MAKTLPLMITAPLHKRLGASLLDGFLLIALTFPIALLAGSKEVAIALSLIANLGYFAYCHSSVHQATVGKRIMRIMVVDMHGNRITQRNALERALAYLIPFLPQFSSLAPEQMASIVLWLIVAWFAPMFFTKHKQGLHDILCNTRVIVGRVEG